MFENIITNICTRCTQNQSATECTDSGWPLGWCLLYLSIFVAVGIFSIWRGWQGFHADYKFYKSRGWQFDKDSGMLFGQPNDNYVYAMKPFLRFVVGYPGLMAGGVILIGVMFS